MGFILLFILIVLILEMISIKKSIEKAQPCSIHKWQYYDVGTEREYMRCETCKVIPGHF